MDYCLYVQYVYESRLGYFRTRNSSANFHGAAEIFSYHRDSLCPLPVAMVLSDYTLAQLPSAARRPSLDASCLQCPNVPMVPTLSTPPAVDADAPQAIKDTAKKVEDDDVA